MILAILNVYSTDKSSKTKKTHSAICITRLKTTINLKKFIFAFFPFPLSLMLISFLFPFSKSIPIRANTMVFAGLMLQKKHDRTVAIMLIINCNWLTFYSPYSFASQAFACFALLCIYFII